MNGRTTSLYVFDSDLKQIGKTENLAQGESVKSVRFDGDIAYFVTFRQTDPLFVIDLADPKNPTVKGELKIPGFSQYLHPIADGFLVGVGQDGTETGVNDDCKVSLFDVTNPYEPKETYNPGDAVCSGPNGTISKMTRAEIRDYPERIVGTVSEIPTYEVWGSGNIKVNGVVRIDGDIDGNLETDGNVIIGENARIRGNINAKSIIVGGIILGNIFANESVKVLANSIVIGDILSHKVQIEDDALVNGKCISIRNEENYTMATSKYLQSKAIIEKASI